MIEADGERGQPVARGGRKAAARAGGTWKRILYAHNVCTRQHSNKIMETMDTSCVICGRNSVWPERLFRPRQPTTSVGTKGKLFLGNKQF